MKSWIKAWTGRYWNSFSFVGLVFGTLFLAESVTPSLLPRNFVIQGLLSGFALAAGYGVGILVVWLWQFLELSKPGVRLARISKQVSAVSSALVFGWFFRQMTFWQNSIRDLMEMEPLQSAYPYRTALIAIVSSAVLIAIVRMLLKSGSFFAGKLNRFLPRRVSYVLSAIFVGFLFLFVVNGVLSRTLLNAADSFFAQMDEFIDEGVEQPTISTASGSSESLIAWDTIGRRGNNFIVDGPTREKLIEFSGRETQQPLRVYVGLRSRPTLQQRAKLALEELKRVGGWVRTVAARRGNAHRNGMAGSRRG